MVWMDRVQDYQASAPRVQWTIRVGFGDPAFPAILAVVFLLSIDTGRPIYPEVGKGPFGLPVLNWAFCDR